MTDPQSRPYFRARIEGDMIRTEGPHTGTLGWPIEMEPGQEREGIFASWHWDGNRLTVRNDRYGFYPMFYFVRDGEICLSPSLVHLVEAGAPTELDYGALSIFLRFGSFINEDTPFTHIRALPPRCLLEWSRDGFSVSGGEAVWGSAVHAPLEEITDEYRRLFHDAIARRLPPSDRFTIALSGGRDSRHILLELCEQGHKPPFCITSRYFPPLRTADLEIAADVARTLGVEHRVVDAGASELEAELWKHRVAHFGSLESGWMFGMARYLTGRVDAIYEGIGGDLLSTAAFLRPENLALVRAGRFRDWADRLLDPIGMKKLVVPSLSGLMRREEAVDRLAREIEKCADAPDPVNMFYFWTRTRRTIALAPYAVLGHIPRVFSPYLDHRLFDFLSGLTAELKLECSPHDETIKRAYPAYAHLPLVSRENVIQEPPGTDRRFIHEFAWYLAKRRPCRSLRYQYIMPRLLASIFTRRYAATSHWFIRLVVYLCELEALARRKVPCDRGYSAG